MKSKTSFLIYKIIEFNNYLKLSLVVLKLYAQIIKFGIFILNTDKFIKIPYTVVCQMGLTHQSLCVHHHDSKSNDLNAYFYVPAFETIV